MAGVLGNFGTTVLSLLFWVSCIAPAAVKKPPDHGASLAFVIDTSASMTPVMKTMVTWASQMLSPKWNRNNVAFSNFILSPFNDPGHGPLTITKSTVEFVKALKKLKAKGGDDCPEMAFSGILSAANVAKENSVLIVFTDATAKDASLFSKVEAQVLSKSLRVVFAITGCCGHDPCQGAESALFRKLASLSNGAFYKISILDMGHIIKMVTLASIQKNFKIPSTFKKLTLFITKKGTPKVRQIRTSYTVAASKLATKLSPKKKIIDVDIPTMPEKDYKVSEVKITMPEWELLPSKRKKKLPKKKKSKSVAVPIAKKSKTTKKTKIIVKKTKKTKIIAKKTKKTKIVKKTEKKKVIVKKTKKSKKSKKIKEKKVDTHIATRREIKEKKHHHMKGMCHIKKGTSPAEIFVHGCTRFRCHKDGFTIVTEKCDAAQDGTDCKDLHSTWSCKAGGQLRICVCIRDEIGVLIKIT